MQRLTFLREFMFMTFMSANRLILTHALTFLSVKGMDFADSDIFKGK